MDKGFPSEIKTRYPKRSCLAPIETTEFDKLESISIRFEEKSN